MSKSAGQLSGRINGDCGTSNKVGERPAVPLKIRSTCSSIGGDTLRTTLCDTFRLDLASFGAVFDEFRTTAALLRSCCSGREVRRRRLSCGAVLDNGTTALLDNGVVLSEWLLGNEPGMRRE